MATPSGAGGSACDQFCFSAGDGFLRAGAFGMDGADIGDHTHGWQGDIAQEGDLTGNVESHFQHGALMPGPQLEQGERQADLVVQVAGALERAVAL